MVFRDATRRDGDEEGGDDDEEDEEDGEEEDKDEDEEKIIVLAATLLSVACSGLACGGRRLQYSGERRVETPLGCRDVN